MRHLVTGGSGFLGNLIAKHLIERGEEVRILDIWEDPDGPKPAQFIKADILDREAVREAIKGVNVVHHTAALVPVTKAGEMFRKVNVEGTRIMAEEAARAGVESFVNMSSSAIYGITKSPVSSTAVPKPAEEYGQSKLDGELAAKEVSEKTGMPLISVRPRTIIDKGRLGIFQVLFDWIKSDVNVYVIGDGTNRIQFLHAQDLINCYLLLVDLRKPGFYNMGTDRFNSIEANLTNLIKHAGSRSKVRHLPNDLTKVSLRTLDKMGLSPLAPWHYLSYGEDFFFDVTALKELGWQPQYSNDEMLIESYDSFVANYQWAMKGKEGSAHRKPLKEKVLALVKLVSRF
ncbi:MAG: NAD-dependent epimerase/dehydratase family protein [Candidatus Obscuribacter sp.]|jgi:nucleoside-diphosphate-sugar epimerase|nr:NAD-dependent epimerase/dehydratase family protein [Candidatus Obscuribacter sp.]MBK9772734.1 NAD-dependent epimerase/dehydratase family protein [Candidatus Obscuribacter sp.]MDQ5965410.1 hypothetical protein [Cyanobacteriota bacterium erpe_2018_sw_39hr_WHONDRS-SW48-000098_B_bin.30]